MGVGGAPEGVLTAAAIRCLGGEIQCRAWPRSHQETEALTMAGLDVDRVYLAEEMVRGEDVFFAATGASSGELLEGVTVSPEGTFTQSLVMCLRSGTVRWVDCMHTH